MILNQTKLSKIYDALIRWPLYLLAALLPVFFLPWTVNVLDFNKQSLMLVLVSISFIFWIVKSLSHGAIKINFSPLFLPLCLFAFIYFLASSLSLYKHASIWGASTNVFEGFITIIGFFVFFILVVSNLSRRDVFLLICLFSFSSILVFLNGILQLAGISILFFSFTRSTSFNTIGAINSLGIFAAVLIPLVFSLIYVVKRALKVFFIILLVLCFVVLLLVDFKIAWLIAAGGCALFIVMSMQKRELIGGNKMIMPMFLLAISLLFVFFNFQISNIFSRPIEVYLNQKVSLGIAFDAIKERPIFGTGPGTFGYDFAKYRSIDFNNTPLWNVRFQGAGSKISNILAEIGILGFLSFIFLLVVFFFYGLLFFLGGRRYLKKSDKRIIDEPEFQESGENKFFWIVGVGVFISFVSLTVSYFFYNTNLTLDFFMFLIFAAMAVIFYPEKKEIALKTSSIPTLSLTFILMISFIATLGILISGTQKYIAEVYYFKAVTQQSIGNIDASLAFAERAAALNQNSDILARVLAQIYLLKLNAEIQRTDIPVSQVSQNAQKLVQLSASSAQRAVILNPFDPANWSIKGYVYQSLIPLFIGFDEEAIKAYEEAIRIDKFNPYYPTQEGIIMLAVASQLSAEQKKDKEAKFEDAEIKFKKALELKPDYAAALFQLSVLYQAQGKTDEAIEQLKKAEIAAPFDLGLIFQLGIVYYGNGKYENARLELEKAVNLNPQYSNALYFLGLTYDKQGKRDKAIEMIEKVISLNPDNSDVKKVLDNLKAGRGAFDGLSSKQSPAQVLEAPAELQGSPNGNPGIK